MNDVSMITNISGKSKELTSVSFAVLVLILFLCCLLDLPSNLKISGTTISSLLTLGIVSLIWLTIFVRPWFPQTFVMVWFILLFIWGITTFLWFSPHKESIQNISTLFIFIGVTLITARECNKSSRVASSILNIFKKCSIVTLVLYAGITLVLGEQASREIMFPRVFAIFALLIECVFLTQYRYNKSKINILIAIISIAMIGISLSRTALVVALILVPISFIKISLKGILKTIIGLLVISITIYVLINYVEVIRNRFFDGDVSLTVGGIPINAMGRTKLWEYTLMDYKKSPILGRGVGSAEVLLGEIIVTVKHPHNDYLRVLHDYGLVGFVFMLLGCIGLTFSTLTSWIKSEKEKDERASYHLTAFLSLIAVLFLMLTDNPITYIYIMAPLGVFLGLSIGVRKPKKLNKKIVLEREFIVTRR